MLPHSPIKTLSMPVIRILIGSYFLASIGLIDSFGSEDILSALIPMQIANMFTASLLYATSLAVMVGVFVRPAALILAVFFFWTSFIQHAPSFTFANLTEFWRDMALVAAVLLVAETAPSPMRQRLRRAMTRPRRVNVATNPFDGSMTLQPKGCGVAQSVAPAQKKRQRIPENENIFSDQFV